MNRTKRVVDQQLKESLKRLKRAGLYSGDLRKEPTKYAKQLTKKYSDYLNDKAVVVSIPKIKHGKSTGKRDANKTAKELAVKFSETMRAHGNKIVVGTAVNNEKAIYLPSQKTIVMKTKRADGSVVLRIYSEKPEKSLPALGENQTFSLPFKRGRNGVDYVSMADEKEILALANIYETKAKNPYKGATGYIMLTMLGDKIPRPKKSRKPKPPKRTADVIDINTRRKR
jgi:hypothetical protein